MSIKYTYEIINVDEKARCMEIIYRSNGRKEMHISARLPWEGESLEAVIDSFSPVAYWQEQERPIQSVQVGKTGTIVPAVDIPVAPEDMANADMLLEFTVEQKVAKALVKFGVLESDPTTIEVTKL